MSTNHSALSRSTQTGPSPSSACSSQTGVGSGSLISAPSCVDEIFVTGDQSCIGRSEEQDQRCNILWNQPTLERLRLDDLGLALRRVPFELPRRAHIARDNAGHADFVATEIAGKRARHAFDRCLAGLIKNEL